MSLDNLKKWARKKIGTLSLALANVEKNSLGQKGESLASDAQQVQRHSQGQLADSLVHGEVTQEVIDLRWRMYKILKETEGYQAEIVGYDKSGMPIVKTRKVDKKKGLDKIHLDRFDPYPLEMVVDNSDIVLSLNDSLNNDHIKVLDEPTLNSNSKDTITSATHANISSDDYFATHKTESPIKISRKEGAKFNIERYTKKLHIRDINGTKKMLEFYTSMYPNLENKRSTLFISDVKKAIKNPITSSMLDIDAVEFVTYKTLGADDFLEYRYKVTSFDKIIEFNGNYVFKFIAEVEINGKDILEDYRVVELDEKYKTKEKKKQK